MKNEVGEQYKKRSKQNGQGHANEMLVSLAGEVVQASGKGRGRGKPFPRGVREDDLPLNHLSPKGWWDFE